MTENLKPKWFFYTLIGIILCCGCGIIISVGFYLSNFSGREFSDNPEQWGQFADYFGGMLNPLLSLINVCVFAILTLLIQNISNRNNQNNIDAQKEISLVVLRYEEFKSFMTLIDSDFEEWGKEINDIDKAKKCLQSLEHFAKRADYLYPNVFKGNSYKTLNANLKSSLAAFDGGDLTKVIGGLQQTALAKETFLAEIGKMVIE